MKLQIVDLSYDGAGVAKSGGKVIFVPKTLPGEVVEAEIIKDYAKFSLAKCPKVVEASPFRREPLCPYFSVCGGCDFQHCDYSAEQNFKRNILAKELAKISYSGKINFVPSPKRYGYRNKIKLEVVGGKLGYFKPRSHDFFEVKTCPIASEKVQKAFDIVREYLSIQPLENLKNVYIKNVGEDVAICFLFPKNAAKSIKKPQNLQFFGNFSVFLAFGDILESDSTNVVCVYGKDILSKDLGGINAYFQPQAFNQINDEVAEAMYKHVLSFAHGKNVVNAYAGQGLLTFLISKSAKFVWGIELQQSAHRAAQAFKADNICHICGKVEEKLPLIDSNIDLIVLDPAREGCKPAVLQTIMDKNVAEIVYISCNFSTLIRDLKALQGFYEIVDVTIFDMFPCTANLETCVKLKRKGAF